MPAMIDRKKYRYRVLEPQALYKTTLVTRSSTTVNKVRNKQTGGYDAHEVSRAAQVVFTSCQLSSQVRRLGP